MTELRVAFPDGVTGSTLLRDAMLRAQAAFPELASVTIPAAGKRFKAALPELIGEFEARRASRPDRVSIATLLAEHASNPARFGDGPLNAALESGDPGPAVEVRGTRVAGWAPRLEYGGRTWWGAEIAELVERMREDCLLTQAAADGITWTVSQLERGVLDLSGKRFAILGAQAELAPTRILLEAGARVLWVDRAPPALDPTTFGGTLVYHPGALDLLCETPQIRAAIAQEATRGDVHLGLYAYAPGRGRELTLTAAMNAIADAVGPASVSMLVSPTTPGEVPLEDRIDRADRRANARSWQHLLARAGMLAEPAFHEHGDVQISRSIVALQGSTYLAAQYLMKMMTAEAWVTRPAMRVSCNVAGITNTKSLMHPLFQAGFRGATAFGIHVFSPTQTRVLNTLLMLRDILDPDAPATRSTDRFDRARVVMSQSIHGGVRSAPFVLEHSIRVAAVLGLTKNPGLLLGLARG